MRDVRHYLLIFLVCLLPLTSLFASLDLLHTHDGLVHLPRIAAYFKALLDGQFPVRWAGDLNYGYGLPLFNFIYQLPYFIASIFLFLGATLVDSFKLTLTLSFILSGIFMLAFTKAFFEDERKAFLVTIFYQFAPFRLVEVLVRGSFGEVYTYAFLPLVLFGLTMLWKKRTYRHFLLTVIATALLILSHNSVSLLFFGVCVGFLIFFAKKRENFFFGTLALFLGLAASAFYWFPALYEHKYTYGDLFMRRLYLEHFAPIQNFFIPNITNDKSLQIGSVSVQIGLFHVAALILTGAALFTKNMRGSKTKKIIICGLLLTLFSVFFTQPISKPFWENISLLRQFQFPWRFLSVIVFATSMLSVSFLTIKLFKKQFVFHALIALVVLSTIFYWRPQEGYDKINEDYYWNFPLNTTYYGETDLVWSAGPKGEYPKKPFEVIGGEAKVSEFRKKSNLHTFTVVAETDAMLVDHTQYFPGWHVYVDGNDTEIQFQDPNWRGEIEFAVPKGQHSIRVTFEETKLRLASNALSLISFLFLLLLPIYQYIFNNYIKRYHGS